MSPGIVFIDDAAARDFAPFASSRPLCEMRAGALLIRERWQRTLGDGVSRFVSSPWLANFTETDAARSLGTDEFLTRDQWLVNSRALPHLGGTESVDADARVITVAGEVAAIRLNSELAASVASGSALTELAAAAALPGVRIELPGKWLEHVWDITTTLNDFLSRDIEALAAAGGFAALENPGVRMVAINGQNSVWLEEGADIEPFVSFDTTAGPVMLKRGSIVHSFTRIVGPCIVGEGSSVAGDKIANCSIGPVCRVHGEVSSTIFVGYSNKGHDGFVGHSVLGHWVNLGAGTTTSNLKNTYGTVALWTPYGVRDTGLQFLGTLFGDHVKTGIGLRLTTGSVLGAGANVYDAMPPRYVPPFSWGSGEGRYTVYDGEKFAATAIRVMQRRGIAADEATLAYFQNMHENALRERDSLKNQ